MRLRAPLLVLLLLPLPAGAVLPELRPETPWKQDVSAAPLDSDSAAIIAWLASQGGFGGTGTLRIDFSIDVVETAGGDPVQSVVETVGYAEPDCDAVQPIPLPVGGTVQGNPGYQCTSGGDCLLLAWDSPTKRLFELYQASLVSGTLSTSCLVAWDLDDLYPPGNRGENCTGADISGMPIAPLLIDADEVATDSIDHALRFALPNPRVRRWSWIDPASHFGGATSTSVTAPPLGTRLRLRADYPLASLPNEGARAVARALQRYGMVLSEGGNFPLFARTDRGTTQKWAGLLTSTSLSAIVISDFQVVAAGEPHVYPSGAAECVRQGPIEPVPTPTWPVTALLALALVLAARRAAR